MNNLNTVLPNGTFGVAVSTINSNFSLIVSAINSLEYASTKSRGIYNYGFTPSTSTLPNAVKGDWCMVLREGNVFPADIYTFNGTSWTKGGTWNPEGIDLTQYAKTSDMNAAIAQAISQVEIETVDNLNEETAASGKALDAHQGFVLAGQIGDIGKRYLINPTIIDTSSFTKNAKYINSSNVWAQDSTKAKARSINIPVIGGEVYVLESNGNFGAIYALLKSNTSVGNPVDFSSELNHRVVLNPNEKVLITIPNDTTILYIFAETKGGDNFLPSALTKGSKIQGIADDIYGNISNKSATVPNMNALEQIYKDESIDVFDTTFLQYAKYINSSNVWAQDTSTNKARCILVPVKGGESYKIKADINFGSIYAFLRSNTSVGNPVDFSAELNHRVVLSAGQETIIKIPDDTMILYMFAHTKGGDNFLPQSLVRLSKISNIAGQTYKTYSKGVMMGDSITAGVYSYFNGNQRWNGFQSGDGVSDYIGKIMNCPFENVGKRGTGYVADTRNINNAWEQAQVTDFSQYDLVVMMYGVNDYIQGVTLGTIEDNIVDTVAGNMIRVFNKIFTDNPLCKVLCVGSYNTWGQVSQGGDYTSNVTYGDESTDYGLGYAINGNTLRDVLNLQKQVCEHFHIQYFCLADEGIVNLINIKNVLVDGLHPTLELRKYIAQEIAKKLV